MYKSFDMHPVAGAAGPGFAEVLPKVPSYVTALLCKTSGNSTGTIEAKVRELVAPAALGGRPDPSANACSMQFLELFCRRCRNYNCMLHSGPHTKCARLANKCEATGGDM